MEIRCKITSRKKTQTGSVLFALIAVAVVVVRAAAAAPPAAQANGLVQPPSGTEFAGLIADSMTAYQKANRISARLTDVHCVRASSVDYMCSYAVTSSDRSRTCHLMQARWTPNSASLYTVTLDGSVPECDSLRQALRSLR